MTAGLRSLLLKGSATGLLQDKTSLKKVNHKERKVIHEGHKYIFPCAPCVFPCELCGSGNTI